MAQSQGEKLNRSYRQDPTMANQVEPSSFCDLFRFADSIDQLLMIIGTIFSLANGVSLIFYSQPFGQLVDALNPYSPPDKIVEDSLATVYAFLINSALVFANSWFMSAAWTITSQRQMIRARKEYFASLLKQESAWHDRNKPEEVCSKMYIQISKVHHALVNNITSMTTKLSIGVSGIIIALVRGWKMSIVMISFLPIMMIAGFVSSYYLKRIESYSQQHRAAIDSDVIQIFDNIKTVKYLGGQLYQSKRYCHKVDRMEAENIQSGVKSKLAFGLFYFCILINYTLGFWYGAKLVSERTLNQNTGNFYTASDVIVIFFTLYMSNLSLSGLPESVTALNISRTYMKLILNIIDRQQRIVEGQELCPIGITEIEFRDILFQYDKPLFTGFNLTIKKGTTALIGESGSGKTTIINLISRFYDTLRGEVLFHSSESEPKNIKDMTFQTLRRRIGYVGQEPVLIGKTIRQALGAQSLSDSQIDQILKVAQAYQFVKEIGVDQEYQSLSGGQRQRIAIARALVKKPEILILDEGTSALDRKNQQEVLRALKKRRIPFIIMIAHRIESIINADQIICLEKGVIVAKGNYQEMIAKGYIEESKMAQQQKEESLPKQSAIEDKYQNPSKKVIELIDRERCNQETQENIQKSESSFQCSYLCKLIGYNSDKYSFYFMGLFSAVFIGAVFPAFAYILSKMIVILTGISFANGDLLTGFQEQVANLSLAMFLISIVSLVLISVKGVLFTYLTERLGTKLKKNAFRTLIHKEMIIVDQLGPQKLAHIVTINCQDLKLLGGFHLSDSTQNLVTIIVGLSIAFAFSWQITLVALGVFPFIILSGKIQMSFSNGMSSNTDKQHKKTHELVIESVMHHKTVRSLHSQEKLLKQYSELLSNALTLSIKYGNLTGIMFGIGQSLVSILLALIFYVGALFIQQNLVTVLDLYTAIYAIMFAGVQAGGNLLFLTKLEASKIAAINYFQLVSQFQEQDQSFNAERSQKGNILMQNKKAESPSEEEMQLQKQTKGSIQFHDLEFKYPNRNEELLQHFYLQVENGTKVSLVGQSGSGKSTVIDLLFGIYEPISGQILINGKNIKEYESKKLKQILSIVSQEPVLFNRSVFENIRYNTNASFQEVVQASRISNSYEFICKGAFGFDNGEEKESRDKQKEVDQLQAFRKCVGPRGSHLSGGQKQRIAISRALIRRPKILVLDEATSALDNKNEQIIQKALSHLQSITQIVIAHRLSTVENSQKIVVMKQGHIVEEGNYYDLLNKRGHFYALVKAGEADSKLTENHQSDKKIHQPQ